MDKNPRREFIKQGAVAATAALGTALPLNALAHAPATGDKPAEPIRTSPERTEPVRADDQHSYDGFSRFRPSRGNSPDSDFYLGKLVPGLRAAGDAPTPFLAPDLEKLPFELKNGVKEFQLVAQPVRRELLPGYWMNFYGYNGSMPGPVIEVVQGDRIRLVVTNELPEDTVVHCHGFELPIQYDGSSELVQNMIRPGKSFVYEFDVHEEGTFFYHSHVPMQEAFGMVGWIIVHPKKAWSPPVDRDFGLIFQNFFIDATRTVPDSWRMDWNWHTINGRSGPYTTPLVVKHGERVRIRIMNFSSMQHHPIHLHGHTFWITGHEGARAPKSAWVPRNTELIGIAQATDFEFIANNPGDWMFHCHMVHHMMNHMVRQVGPRMRKDDDVDRYLADLSVRPEVAPSGPTENEPAPGYPQIMQGMQMSEEMMKKIWSRREVLGMRSTWPMSVMGLMTTLRVLPDDLYRRVMESDEEVAKDSVFEEIIRRFGDSKAYQAPMPAMKMKM